MGCRFGVWIWIVAGSTRCPSRSNAWRLWGCVWTLCRSRPDHGLTLKDAEGAALIQRARRDSPGQRLDLWWAMRCWRSMAIGCDAAVTFPFCLRSRNVNVTYARRSLMKETRSSLKGVDHWTLDWDPECTTEQRQLRDRWFEIV